MKALAVSYKGMEDITELEIKELLQTTTEKKESCVIFEANNYEDLALLCYKAQSINRVMLLLDTFTLKSAAGLKRIADINLSDWLKGRTFAARAHLVETNLDTSEIERAIGDEVEGKVNLNNPDITIFAYVYKEDCYVGIDFGGDLSKRDYKINTTRFDIRGTIAYALVRLTEFNSEVFFNPFCNNGTIAVEAALFASGLSPNYYNKTKFPFLKFMDIDLSTFDKEKKETEIFAFDHVEGYLRSTANNAKAAGVKINLEEPGRADSIAANLPKDIGYKEFLTQLKRLMKKETNLVISSIQDQEIKKAAKEIGLQLKEEREITHGKETLKIATFKNQ